MGVPLRGILQSYLLKEVLESSCKVFNPPGFMNFIYIIPIQLISPFSGAKNLSKAAVAYSTASLQIFWRSLIECQIRLTIEFEHLVFQGRVEGTGPHGISRTRWTDLIQSATNSFITKC